MRKAKSCAFLLTLILALALQIMPFGSLSVFAAESTDTQVTAMTSASVKQGNSGYCYVYIDSLESLSTLSVTVHYDADKVKVQSGYVYNSVSSLLNDKSVSESSVQFSYIFDGKGKAEKTQLFYFRYTVLSDAEVGDAYFDIVVNEAYDSSLQPINVSGSRCSFKVAETVTTKTCSIYSSSSVSTSVGEEFEISYRLSTYQIASGSFIVSYDPELFEVVDVTNGAFCNNKIVDVNTKLAGSVYVSFVGTEYKSNTNIITVKFKTLKNVAEKSTIKMTVTEFYDLALNPISCSGYTTTANIAFDETYTEDAPSMTLQTAYNAATDKVALTTKLDKDSMLGAGDFVLKFNTDYLTYNSAEKGFSPTFFNINDKNVADGILKFSIISLSNITDEQIVLTVTFDVKHTCEDKLADFEISGSGLTDALTNTIVLNFVDASVTIPLEHIAATAVAENEIAATCTSDGSYDSVVYCSVCSAELERENRVIGKLGHDYDSIETEPTCLEKGYTTHTCHCGDNYITDYVDALGHTEGEIVVENNVLPTCTETGSYDNVVYCSICDKELSRENIVVDELGHNYGAWNSNVNGTHTKVCSHDESHVITEDCTGGTATCTAKAECTRCHELYGDMLEHSYTNEDATDAYLKSAATCTSTAVYYKNCATCDKAGTVTFEYGSFKTHSYIEKVEDAYLKSATTCTSKAVYYKSCSDCGVKGTETFEVGDAPSHNYQTAWSSDATSHWHECSKCGDKLDTASHTAGTAATESTAQTCTVCGYVITPALGHTHNYNTTWSNNATEHWHDCVGCSSTKENAPHDYTNACDTDCNTCGYIRTITHSYKNEWSSNAEKHWYECSVCGDKSSEASHIPGAEATETTDQVCTICNYVIQVSLGHTHNYENIKKDDANHWKECACGEKNDITEHTWDNGEVTKEATVDEEGTKIYTCTYCSHTKTESIAKLPSQTDTPNNPSISGESNEDDGLSGGTIVGIAVGATATASLSGFSIFWFIIKKKKWSDLIAMFKKK